MTNRLVPSESATIQAAIDYMSGLGSLVGTGENKILVSAGTYTENLSGAGLTTDETGFVTIEKDGAGEVLIITTTGIDLNNSGTYNGLRGCHVQPSATMATATNTINADGQTFFESGRMENPNGRDVHGFRGTEGPVTLNSRIEDFVIEGFSGGYKRAVSFSGNAKRGVIYNCYNGGYSGAFTDVAAINCTLDFGGTATTTNSASSDATATGTNCIINIVAATEFVDAANGDYTLAIGSQLIGAGSTGNNIGWDQSVAPTITSVDTGGDNEIYPSQVDIPINIANAPSTVTSFDQANLEGTKSGTPPNEVITGGIDLLNLRWNGGLPLVDAPAGVTIANNQTIHIKYTP